MNKFFNVLVIDLLLIAISISESEAQLASGMPHLFSVSTAALPPFGGVAPPPMTNIILTSPPRSVSQTDEWDSLVAPIGWSFTFAGMVYTKLVVSSNGWLALMPSSTTVIPPTIPNALPNNLLSNNTTGFPIIAPLWDDIATSAISYLVNTNALWIRWACKWDKNNTANASPLVYAKLDGADNSITFYYGNFPAYVPTSPSATIGLAGTCIGDFYSVNCTSQNTAFIDSIVENTTIGIDTSVNFRPYNCAFIFKPYNFYDDCSGVQSAKYLGTVNSTCLWLMGSTFNAGVSGSGCCATSDVRDVWFSFFKPAGITDVYIRTSPAFCNSVSGTSIEVYDSCGGNLRGCSTTSLADTGFGELTISSAIAETLFVRLTADGDMPGKFQLCVQDLLTASVRAIDKSSSFEFLAYPNPASDKITVSFNGLENSDNKLTMIDLLGRLIYSSIIRSEHGDNYKELDVSNFSKGLYVIRLENEEMEMSKRVLIE